MKNFLKDIGCIVLIYLSILFACILMLSSCNVMHKHKTVDTLHVDGSSHTTADTTNVHIKDSSSHTTQDSSTNERVSSSDGIDVYFDSADTKEDKPVTITYTDTSITIDAGKRKIKSTHFNSTKTRVDSTGKHTNTTVIKRDIDSGHIATASDTHLKKDAKQTEVNKTSTRMPVILFIGIGALVLAGLYFLPLKIKSKIASVAIEDVEKVGNALKKKYTSNLPPDHPDYQA